MKKNKRTEKLYWRSLANDCRLRYDAGSYWLGKSILIFWHEGEETEAKRFLNTQIR